MLAETTNDGDRRERKDGAMPKFGEQLMCLRAKGDGK